MAGHKDLSLGGLGGGCMLRTSRPKQFNGKGRCLGGNECNVLDNYILDEIFSGNVQCRNHANIFRLL